MYQLVLVQPIISLVSSSRWSPLGSALILNFYIQKSQVTPEAKTHDQIRCVQLHNHISCLQSKDLAEKCLDKLRQRPGVGLGMLRIQKEQRRIVCMQKRRGEYSCWLLNRGVSCKFLGPLSFSRNFCS